MRIVPAIASLVALSGCDMLFPEDPRLGIETQEACIARVDALVEQEFGSEPADSNAVWVPTFTYDVTKLGLEAIQELSVEGSAETAGRELSTSTNEASTALDAFMSQPVDEKGAFFLANDPALYRVRGEPVAIGDAVAAGCARQRPNMRLTGVRLDRTDNAQLPGEDSPELSENPENETR